MLNLYFGELEDCIRYPKIYFDNCFEPECLESDLAKQMVEDIDKSVVLAPYCIESPVFGQIASTMLSGGVKTLLVLLNTDAVCSLNNCGDNCVKWLLQIAEEKDITACVEFAMSIGNGPYKIRILNSGNVITNHKEYCDELVKWL